jgi:hypothetical protein
MYQRTRKRKNGTTWTAFYYRDATGKDVPLGKDLDKARLKWAELEAKDKPSDLTMMKGIFDRYERDVIPKKGERTQKDNLAELKQLRPMFDGAPIDSITPANIAGYRDARTAKVRANREIALLSHVFNLAREWGLTEREKAQQKAIDQGDPMLAAKIGGFQFRDIRPKAASEIVDIGDASLLLGHSKQEITKRVYRRIGATAKPSK